MSPQEAVFIFRKPGGLFGDATVQKIDRDIETARRMLAQRPRSLAEIETFLGAGQPLDDQANILQLPANFIGVCRTFCPLWQVCLNEGRQRMPLRFSARTSRGDWCSRQHSARA